MDYSFIFEQVKRQRAQRETIKNILAIPVLIVFVLVVIALMSVLI